MSELLQTEYIADFLRLVREREEMSMRDFARELGITATAISQAENGHYVRPASYLKLVWRLLSDAEREHVIKLMLKSYEQTLRAELGG